VVLMGFSRGGVAGLASVLGDLFERWRTPKTPAPGDALP